MSTEDEITSIQNELDETNDTSYDYIPEVLKDLRHYILQVHALYEQSLNIVLLAEYLKRRPMEANTAVFEQITFDGKLKLLQDDAPTFPFERARRLNIIRNEFVHKEGSHLRTAYPTAESRLKVYKHLKKSKDSLNDYYEQLS